LGWLKWREFGRRGDTARDQVIHPGVKSQLVSNVRALCLPVGFRVPKQVPLSPFSRKGACLGGEENVTHQTSDQGRLPAEFKHITKRRRRN
jgi:hypothetical protein